MRSNTVKTAYASHGSNNGDNREVERGLLSRRGVLRVGEDVQASDVLVLDLTRDGCGIQCSAPVKPGTRIEIGIANVGRISGTVLWHGPDSFGCMFDRPLPAGSVTAAFGPPNVLSFPLAPESAAPSDVNNKLAPRTRLLMIGVAMALCWSAVGAVAFVLA